MHSLRDGVDLAERDLPATLRRGVERIATVQVSDLMAPSTTIPDRAGRRAVAEVDRILQDLHPR